LIPALWTVSLSCGEALAFRVFFAAGIAPWPKVLQSAPNAKPACWFMEASQITFCTLSSAFFFAAFGCQSGSRLHCSLAGYGDARDAEPLSKMSD
jgi:hypothetical protein